MQIRHLPLLANIQHNLENLATEETEESLLLRLLVQALVVVGIIATDVAAATQMSIWAVPLSVVAALWSWQNRRRHNIVAKFLIAIGMLIAMAAFLRNIVANLNDTRLVLAELLVQLQVLHSFDLPRRKDLGYSMVIGLILLGVAATLSQTLAFAPWLVLFLALALPILVLDYRSRLGLPVIKPLNGRVANSNLPTSNLSLKRLGSLLLVIVLLGLGIFALLPRFPSSQQLSFPVSSPVDVDNERFGSANRGIFDAGSGAEEGSEGSGGEGSGDELGTEAGGEAVYYGFQSQIDQTTGNTSTLEPKLVMRVRSQAPGFWRVLAFDRYTGKGWEISRDEDLKIRQRSNFSYRFFLGINHYGIRSRRVVQTYTIVADLPNLVPALTYPVELYFPTSEVAIDPENGIRAPLALADGLTYSVISRVPYRNRTRIREASQNYPSSITEHYLQVPEAIKEQVQQRAKELLANSTKPITSPYEQALFLAQALKQRYSLLEASPALNPDQDLVSAFLFDYRGGFQDQFSTVLTIMLRSLGIPARLTVGYDTGQFNPFTGFYLVRNTDAYALTEVFFPGYGWFTFDPIPGHELIPQSVEDSQTFSVLKQFWSWVAGWLPSPVTAVFSGLWSGLIGIFSRTLVWLWRLISSGLVGFFVGSILLVFLGFLGWLGWKQIARWRYRLWLTKLAPMARIYQQMLQVLATQGYPKQAAQTPLEYAASTYTKLPSKMAAIVSEITHAYVDWRYGGQRQDLAYLQQQLRLLRRFGSKKTSVPV